MKASVCAIVAVTIAVQEVFGSIECSSEFYNKYCNNRANQRNINLGRFHSIFVNDSNLYDSLPEVWIGFDAGETVDNNFDNDYYIESSICGQYNDKLEAGRQWKVETGSSAVTWHLSMVSDFGAPIASTCSAVGKDNDFTVSVLFEALISRLGEEYGVTLDDVLDCDGSKYCRANLTLAEDYNVGSSLNRLKSLCPYYIFKKCVQKPDCAAPVDLGFTEMVSNQYYNVSLNSSYPEENFQFAIPCGCESGSVTVDACNMDVNVTIDLFQTIGGGTIQITDSPSPCTLTQEFDYADSPIYNFIPGMMRLRVQNEIWGADGNGQIRMNLNC